MELFSRIRISSIEIAHNFHLERSKMPFNRQKLLRVIGLANSISLLTPQPSSQINFRVLIDCQGRTFQRQIISVDFGRTSNTNIGRYHSSIGFTHQLLWSMEHGCDESESVSAPFFFTMIYLSTLMKFDSYQLFFQNNNSNEMKVPMIGRKTVAKSENLFWGFFFGVFNACKDVKI